MNNEVLNYDDVLKNIEDKENHLLIGNGFNYGLGVNTGYKAIFERMINKEGSIYRDIFSRIEKCNFDLEYFIGELEDEISSKDGFLKKFIRNKIKLDFMQATHKIVKEKLSNIYAENNHGIFILLNKFTNYFTLNYDPFLYLLLLKYKPSSNRDLNSIAMQTSINFIEQDLNEKQNDIFSEIKEARNNGLLRLRIGENEVVKDCKKLTKSHFTMEIAKYSKEFDKGWKRKDIERVVKAILDEEENAERLRKFDDGSFQLRLSGKSEYVFKVDSLTQNVFFLHGAFHIYKDGKYYKKITQTRSTPLYDRLEQILNNDEKEILCVFQHSDKLETIKSHKYLTHCYEKLEQLEGNLVIIGSSLSDNDDHIFEKINRSRLKRIYISAFGDIESVKLTAQTKFPDKAVDLFDAETISYEGKEPVLI